MEPVSTQQLALTRLWYLIGEWEGTGKGPDFRFRASAQYSWALGDHFIAGQLTLSDLLSGEAAGRRARVLLLRQRPQLPGLRCVQPGWDDGTFAGPCRCARPDGADDRPIGLCSSRFDCLPLAPHGLDDGGLAVGVRGGERLRPGFCPIPGRPDAPPRLIAGIGAKRLVYSILYAQAAQ